MTYTDRTDTRTVSILKGDAIVSETVLWGDAGDDQVQAHWHDTFDRFRDTLATLNLSGITVRMTSGAGGVVREHTFPGEVPATPEPHALTLTTAKYGYTLTATCSCGARESWAAYQRETPYAWFGHHVAGPNV